MLGLFTKRYLFTKKNTRAINVISWVSMVAIALGTAALLIVLSVYNGFSHFIEGMYNSVYTDVVIQAKEGKFFERNEALLTKVKNYEGTAGYSQVLEDNVLMQTEGAQIIVKLKGVDKNFAPITGLNKYVKYGDSNLHTGAPVMIGGIGVANSLHTSEQSVTPVRVFSIQGDADLITAPQDAYTEVPLYLVGIFALQDELDNKYCITALAQAEAVLGVQNKLSAIAINLKPGYSAQRFKKDFGAYCSSQQLSIVSKQEQNKTLYYVLSSEKWMSYAILCFVLLIAAFNIIACMSMLVMEKKADINTLKAMGASSTTIRNIFLSTGMAIGGLGAALGIVIALIVLYTQIQFHWLKIGGSDLLIDYYPVRIQALDFVMAIGTVLIISFLAAYLPAQKASKL
jgi:lipoprotein-releasing system permease protein